MAETIRHLSERGVPVCAHLGLLPQSVHKLGGYRIQGRDKSTAQTILDDARSLVEAGADLVLLECVPGSLANKIVSAVDVPVIGIGAGAGCDGQVLVLHDILGITPGKQPKFSKNFLLNNGTIQAAITAYIQSVKNATFPDSDHTFE